MVACAAILCALIVAVPAGAETGDAAPIRPISESGFSFPTITGPEAPEEYPIQLEPLDPELEMRQVNDQEIIVEYPKDGVVSVVLHAESAHDAVGSIVPTTFALTEDEDGPVITLTVHYRAGNPAAGGTPFVFPISGGTGWGGGFHTTVFELNEPKPPATEPSPPPAPICTVPSLHGLGLRAAKARLRTADCGIGQVHLAAKATPGKGKVVKQYKPAGAQLAAGAPVAVKLGSR